MQYQVLLNKHHKNGMVDSKENYLVKEILEIERLKIQASYCGTLNNTTVFESTLP